MAICVFGTRYFFTQVEPYYPVENWLAWHLLPIIGWTLSLNAGFVALGYTVLRRVLRISGLPPAELLLSSMTLGFAAFALVMYGGGAFFWYHWSFALLIPVVFLGVGAWDLPHLWRRIFYRRYRSREVPDAGRIAAWVASGIGALMVGTLYLSSLSPDNFNFDAIWYHVPVAQDYAREGGIVPFYGDNHRAYPHLASFLHTWALLVPGLDPLPTRWMLMLHLEFSFVVWRLVGAVATTQWLLVGRYVPGLWASFFLFPSVFIYDQNIAGSADHVLGATAVPIFLATGRMLKRFEWKWGALAGVAAGCHVLSKYQALYLVVAVFVTVAVRFFWLLGVRGLARLRKHELPRDAIVLKELVRAPLVVVACAAFVSGPHFLKNWVFYDNPVYPFASRIFPSSFEEWEPPRVQVHPLRAESALLAAQEEKVEKPELRGKGSKEDDKKNSDEKEAKNSKEGDAKKPVVASDSQARQPAPPPPKPWTERFRFPSRAYDFSPQGEGLIERVVWLHKTLIDWSFKTGNRHLTKQTPYMGSLFTLLLPVLLFLRRAGRLWFAAAFLYIAFSTWALTNANDRYLLTFLSIPIGMAAALMYRTWRLGWLARVGLIPLVAVQVFWAIDVPLHYGDNAIHNAQKIIHRGYGRSADHRFNYRTKQQQLAEEFPEDALILGRYYKDLLGFDRATLNTHRNIQKYIPFDDLNNTRELWQVARDRGVTHLLYPVGDRKPHWLQDIVLFDALVENSQKKSKKFGYLIAELDDTPPKHDDPLMVLVVGVREYEDGLYPVRHLSVDERKGERNAKSPKKRHRYEPSRAEKLLEEADVAAINGNRLDREASDELRRDFEQVERFGGLAIHVRKRK